MRKYLFFLFTICLLQNTSMSQYKGNIAGDTGAILQVKHDSVILYYHDRVILRGLIRNNTNAYHIGEKKTYLNGKMYQTIVLTSSGTGQIYLSAEITGSWESFPCEAEQPDGLRVVRQVVGLSRSLLNHAVYDRQGDWLL